MHGFWAAVLVHSHCHCITVSDLTDMLSGAAIKGIKAARGAASHGNGKVTPDSKVLAGVA